MPQIPFKGKPMSERFMEPEEFRKLLKTAKGDKLAETIFMLMGIGGLRTIEVERLTVSSVDLMAQRLWVSTAKRKDSHSRSIPLDGALVDLIKPHLKGRKPSDPLLTEKRGPLSKRRVRYIFHSYKTKAKIRKTLGPHSLRHLAGIALSEAGAMPQEVAQYLGHKTLEMCLVYANLRGKRSKEISRAARDLLIGGVK
jgi:integrase